MGKRGNNEGCITQRKDGRWAAVVTIGYDDYGKQKRKTIYGKTRQEVSKKMNSLLEEIDKAGAYFEPSKIQLYQWIDTYLWSYKRPFVKPKTFQSYTEVTAWYIKKNLKDMGLKDLRADTIQKMLINKMMDEGLSARTIKYAYVVLNSALNQAVKNGMLAKNPCVNVTLPAGRRKEIQVMTAYEQQKFVQHIKAHRLGAAFILDMFTGLRAGELLALTWDMIDFENKILRVRKNLQRVKIFESENNQDVQSQIIISSTKTESGVRDVPLLSGIADLLEEHKQRQEQEKELVEGLNLYDDQNLIFCSELGKPLEHRNFLRLFHNELKKAGLPRYSLHSLRHLFATRGLENGIDMKVMQELLGHSSYAVTANTYTHVLLDTKKESVQKLEALFILSGN